ncbi:T9SS type A sorting domain-containing protein [Hymenobacter properus]|uniref:T9SS type A sorting domain-containing protein n=1 Tax=Hymenobacter properus TaxID=2791026 RepID=A0A931FL12_9BACT|nr:T9SS type A sorting domain-containing protein [Hymenobacter properus]MBF9142320.1 T9SS type A sorting domain-containing protein [Hymenobacter properus]MBR7721127.1 T9SS type A sorting domain-containing protein [Microvirga sp. SRT04]
MALLVLCGLLFFSVASQAQTTYYWRGKTNNAWSTANNWNTNTAGTGSARTTPRTDDILIFDGSIGATFPTFIVVDYGNGQAPTSQTINQLRFVNNAQVTFAGPTNSNDGSILTIGGGTPSPDADDFFVQAGSSLTVVASGNTSNRFLLMKIGAGNKGLVNGAITFNAGANTFTRLVPADAGALVFGSTGSFTSTTVNGSPFGTTGSNTIVGGNGGALAPEFTEVTVSNSVVFNSGATYTQQGGLSPFSTGPSPVSVFNSGSFYVYSGGTFSQSGQTYGNLEFTGGTATSSGSQTLTIVNDLKMTGGVFNDNITGYGTGTGTVLQGNLLANGGTLNFTPNGGAGRVGFSGTSLQTISGAGALNFNVNAHVQVNNGAGLTLQRGVQVDGLLILTNGLINTTATSLLTLGNNVTAQGGGSNSYVNGPVAHLTTSGNSSDVLFPVGKSGNYRPLFLNTTGQTTAATYIGEQIESAPNQTLTAPLTRVSFRRYFKLAPTAAVSLTNATVTITFGVDDFVNYPADPTFVMAIRNAANTWSSIGRSTATGTATNGAPVSGSLTSGPFTSFPTTTTGFSLASTSTAIGYPGVNPLPVALTKFSATTKASGIALDWATASEKNSASFEVQRSADGESFETIMKVAAQGNSAVAHSYAALDRTPLQGLSHYRLRQTDLDGTVAYSPVVTARWTVGSEASVYPNPTTGTLYFGLATESAKFRVLNGQGRALLSGQTSAAGLDVKALPAGIYLLEIVTESGRSLQRFVRE